MLRFYGHFAAAYGTLWLSLLLVSVATQTYINTGIIGFYGFPVIALIYAIIRRVADSECPSERDYLRWRVRELEGQLANRSDD